MFGFGNKPDKLLTGNTRVAEDLFGDAILKVEYYKQIKMPDGEWINDYEATSWKTASAAEMVKILKGNQNGL